MGLIMSVMLGWLIMERGGRGGYMHQGVGGSFM